MGFHFAGFALTPSSYPQNWNWYHNDFLGADQYKGNTWRPTSAILKKEDSTHTVTKDLPASFISAPNERYSGKKTCAKIRISIFFIPLTRPAFLWAPVQSNTRYGTAVIIPWYGPIKNIKCSTSTWAVMIWIMNRAATNLCLTSLPTKLKINSC